LPQRERLRDKQDKEHRIFLVTTARKKKKKKSRALAGDPTKLLISEFMLKSDRNLIV
jgi:hypothetical protein